MSAEVLLLVAVLVAMGGLLWVPATGLVMWTALTAAAAWARAACASCLLCCHF